MDNMFSSSRKFDNDISMWCVINISTEPYRFTIDITSSNFHDKKYLHPKWGTCP